MPNHPADASPRVNSDRVLDGILIETTGLADPGAMKHDETGRSGFLHGGLTNKYGDIMSTPDETKPWFIFVGRYSSNSPVIIQYFFMVPPQMKQP